MNKKQKQSLVILAVIAVVFSVIVFLIPFPKHSTFWIAYIAEMLAFALQIPIFKLAYDNAENLKSKVLGFPIFRVGYIYLGVQTVISILLFVLGFIKNFPIWISVVLCFVVFSAAIVCSIAADMARDTVTEIETVQTVNTQFIRKIRIKSQQLVDKTNDTALKKELEKLSNNFRYSDPISSSATAEYEVKLDNLFNELESAVVYRNSVDASALCSKINIVLEDRNILCKMNKH